MKINDLKPVEIDEEKASKIIGSRIMQKRKSKGITQYEFAEIIGLSYKQISNIENGHSFPRMSTFLKICEYFQVNSDYFISGSISKDIDNKIMDLLKICSIEELKCIWKLLDCYIHKDDNNV